MKPHLAKPQLLERQLDSFSLLPTPIFITNRKQEANSAKRIEVLTKKEKEQKINLFKTATELSIYTHDEFKLSIRTLVDLESKQKL
jgi:hypothetical protein